jgi:D-glycero-alpha-D-manno-heptose 1-phosphate guanylyltransferase
MPINKDKSFSSQEKDGVFKEAIILAGGLGTRLRTVVPDLPKSLAPVRGKPFISYVIEYLQKNGVGRFIFSLGYKSELFEDFLNTKFSSPPEGLGFSYQLSKEKEPLGTGGAIRLACSKATEKSLLVVNGDTLFSINLAKLHRFHSNSKAHCTLSLKPMQNSDRYGIVELNEDGSIKSFREKQFYQKGLINGGMYALEKDYFLKEKLPVKFSFENDYLEKFYPQGNIFGLPQDEYFIDIGIPEDYQRAQTEIKG